MEKSVSRHLAIGFISLIDTRLSSGLADVDNGFETGAAALAGVHMVAFVATTASTVRGSKQRIIKSFIKIRMNRAFSSGSERSKTPIACYEATACRCVIGPADAAHDAPV
ncbi:hypothetical protein [Komagataeibacter melaceti]|uniref:hypothetical protein n=1 Tax=Komagataeibacter melaceti TaxID=2766577 RepID=UPI0011E5B890|nr:hypothetical protein [Komagataeibacter melaceti]